MLIKDLDGSSAHISPNGFLNAGNLMVTGMKTSYKGRLINLYDKVIKISLEDNTNNIPRRSRLIKIFKKMNLEVRYDSGTASASNIVQNKFYLYIFVDGTTGDIPLYDASLTMTYIDP